MTGKLECPYCGSKHIVDILDKPLLRVSGVEKVIGIRCFECGKMFSEDFAKKYIFNPQTQTKDGIGITQELRMTLQKEGHKT